MPVIRKVVLLLKIVYFNYAAAAILIIILVSALFRRVGTANGNRVFLFAVTEVLLTTVMDMGAIALDNAGGGNACLKIFFHSGYLLTHTFSSLFYLFYLISLTDTWHLLLSKKVKLCMLSAPAIIYVAVFICNCFGWVDLFHLDEAQRYTRGSWFFIGYAVAGIYMLYGLFYILRFRKLFTAKWILTLFAPYPFLLFGILVQFITPEAVIEMFCNSIALLFVYTNIQKDEELVDPVTGFGNANAFEDCTRRIFFNQKPVTVMMLSLQNYTSLREMLDYANRSLFLRDCADSLLTICKRYRLKPEAFTGQTGRFFLFFNAKDSNTVAETAEIIAEEFNGTRTFHGSDFWLESVISLISIPEDFSEFADFMHYTGGELKNLPIGEVTRAAALLKGNYYRALINIDRIIADALRYGRFEVYYQPIYSCRLKRFVSAEALLRLKDPEYGFISPDLFIPAAERSGAIIQISDFVLKTVCDYIASENCRRLGLEYIEVNLSALECVQDNLPQRLEQVVTASGIAPKQLALEITETGLIYQADKLAENLRTLAANGFRLCLDDYGSGYSDTRRIFELPLSIIKMDKSFLNSADRKLNQVIIRDTIRLIVDIGRHVLAEGVETEEILRFLEKSGCDLIQGYYFSKPVPPAEFEKVCLSLRENET